jgi:hypothetical protein
MTKDKPANSIFILDSGAYSAWRKGIEINLADYIDFIKKHHKYFTHIISLDVIDNPIQSEINHLIMLEELPDLDIIPVFHAGESFEVLDYFIERKYTYIGISPNNGWKESVKQKWLSLVFTHYDFEGIKTHGLGYNSVLGLSKYPLSSADSSAYQLDSAYGVLLTKFGRFAISDITYINKSIHISNQTKDVVEWISLFAADLGFAIDDLISSREARLIFNIEATARIFEEIRPVKLSYTENLIDDEFTYIPFDTKELKGY